MCIDKFIFRFAGSMVLLSLLLAHFVSPYWLWFTAFVGANLLQSGLTGSVLAGYWQRTGLPLGGFPTQGDTQTLNANGSIGWSFNRYVALNAVYIFNGQSVPRFRFDRCGSTAQEPVCMLFCLREKIEFTRSAGFFHG